MSTKRTRLVEVYGSLLNSQEREEIAKIGVMEEVGKVERREWKLSFDRQSSRSGRWKGEAVLNFVFTDNQEDVYYTTVFEVDDIAYSKVMEREMGSSMVEKWKQGRLVKKNRYRPIQLEPSRYGITDIFIIPQEGRKIIPAHWEDKYVNTVWTGIRESYKKCPHQMEVNLNALKRAVEESNKTA